MSTRACVPTYDSEKVFACCVTAFAPARAAIPAARDADAAGGPRREQVYSARRVVWPNRAFMAQLIAYEAVLAAAGRFRPPPPCAADPGGAGGVQPNRRSNRGAGDGVHCGWAPSVTLVEWDRWTAFDPAQGT